MLHCDKLKYMLKNKKALSLALVGVIGAMSLEYSVNPTWLEKSDASLANNQHKVSSAQDFLSAPSLITTALNDAASATFNTIFGVAHADVVAPQAPPELSDTLTDYRTKEQLNEQVYIEGKADPQNSISVPTVPGDLEAKVMRLSATYQSQYEIAVPRHGISILRFYDLNGYPMEVVSTKLENQGFLAEVTASPSELMIRQFQGASTTLLRVRLKGINKNFIFTLKPLVLVNQQSTVRTLITSMTVNYYVEGTGYHDPIPYKFGKPNPDAKALNFSNVDGHQLEGELLAAAALAVPLNKHEEEQAKALRDTYEKELRENAKPHAKAAKAKAESEAQAATDAAAKTDAAASDSQNADAAKADGNADNKSAAPDAKATDAAKAPDAKASK